MQLKPIDVVDDISPEEFHELYVKTGKPLKLRSYAEHWPALHKWTYEFLRQKAGHHQVKLHGAWQDNEPVKIEMPPVKEVPFREYLDMLENDVRSDLRIFLFNLFKLAPELKKDFDYPPIMDGYLRDFPFMFFGCAGSDVRLHYDIDLSNVFITQFGGTKRVTLFDQSQTKYLYRLPFTTHSAADLSNIDYKEFPALKYAQGYRTDLKPGETLFMPSGIWHYMQYTDGSFSLSLRTLTPNSISKVKGAYNVFVMRKLDEFIYRYYKNSWSDYKLKAAIGRANEQIDAREKEKVM